MSAGGGRLRDIYAMMFKYHGLLPGEVGKQQPKMLFAMLGALGENDMQGAAERTHGLSVPKAGTDKPPAPNTAYLKMFYGE